MKTYEQLIESRWIILRMRNVSDKCCRENQNASFVFSNFPPPPKNVVYEILWNYILEPDRPQMTINHRPCALYMLDNSGYKYTQNMECLSLFNTNGGANASRRYDTLHCRLVSITQFCV
jgi:hypothetical protein